MTGAAAVRRKTGDSSRPRVATPRPAYRLESPQARVYVGDCRTVLPALAEVQSRAVDVVFADPPFNWGRAYDQWNDALPRDDYLTFTYTWLDACIRALRPWGALWVNIPDDWAAEIVVYLKGRGLRMVNWCVWHYRFGQNVRSRFIVSKAHVLYFVRPPEAGEPWRRERTWNPEAVLEVSDRRAIYGDPRTEHKRDGMPAGMRVPMDVWYGPFLGRVQGNNRERRNGHDNQLPEAYLARVVLATSDAGDLVLDPFLGSGTTGVVAHALGRRFIGVEYSPALARSAYERMRRGPARPLETVRGVSTAIVPPRHARPRQ